jgi:hypothetical protein
MQWDYKISRSVALARSVCKSWRFWGLGLIRWYFTQKSWGLRCLISYCMPAPEIVFMDYIEQLTSQNMQPRVLRSVVHWWGTSRRREVCHIQSELFTNGIEFTTPIERKKNNSHQIPKQKIQITNLQWKASKKKTWTQNKIKTLVNRVKTILWCLLRCLQQTLDFSRWLITNSVLPLINQFVSAFSECLVWAYRHSPDVGRRDGGGRFVHLKLAVTVSGCGGSIEKKEFMKTTAQHPVHTPLKTRKKGNKRNKTKKASKRWLQNRRIAWRSRST